MNKAELIEAIAKDARITKSQAQDALNSFTKNVENSLKNGGKVTLVGFGTFSISQRAARIGRNPQTGQAINISARKVARFAPGKALKDSVQ